MPAYAGMTVFSGMTFFCWGDGFLLVVVLVVVLVLVLVLELGLLLVLDLARAPALGSGSGHIGIEKHTTALWMGW